MTVDSCQKVEITSQKVTHQLEVIEIVSNSVSVTSIIVNTLFRGQILEIGKSADLAFEHAQATPRRFVISLKGDGF
jgi:ribosomal protein S8E